MDASGQHAVQSSRREREMKEDGDEVTVEVIEEFG